MWHGNVFSHIFLSVCIALTSDSLDLESLFWCEGIIKSSESSGDLCVSRSSGQGQGHRCKMCVCVSCLWVVCLRLN